MTSGRVVDVVAEGLAELQRDLRKAGASVDDMTSAMKSIGEVVRPEASHLVHSRTGALAATVKTVATRTSVSVQAGSPTVPYAGVNHYGWPSRGLGKGRTAKTLIGALGTSGSRTFADRTLRKAARQARKGQVRGGPYPANPFILKAIGHKTDEIDRAADRWADGIAAAVDSGAI